MIPNAASAVVPSIAKAKISYFAAKIVAKVLANHHCKKL